MHTATNTAADTNNTVQAVASAQNLLTSLRSAYVERDTETLCLVLALVCEEHVLLLGPPGTGKTHLASTFAKALDGITDSDVFTYLLGRFSQPDELLGALDLPALKQGIRKRVTTNKLPEAKVAILDEIFKANSAILNSLLTIVNERAFDNPTRQTVPLEMVVGLSNELPEGGPKGPLGALYDRFLFKRWVNYIDTSTKSGANAWSALMMGGAAPRVAVKLARHHVEALRVARKAVDVAQVIPTLLVIKLALEDQHGVVISDRRWGKGLKAVQANAVLAGRSQATADDLAILSECLWDEPAERATIELVIAQHADPGYAQAVEQQDIAREAFAMVPGSRATDAEFGNEAAQAGRAIMDAIKVVETLNSTQRVDAVLAEMNGMVDQIRRQQNLRMGWS